MDSPSVGGKWPRLEGSVSEFLLRASLTLRLLTRIPVQVSSPNPLRVESPGVEGTPLATDSLEPWANHFLCIPVCGQLASPCVPGSPDCSLSLSTPRSSVRHHLTVTPTQLYLLSPNLVFYIHKWHLRPLRSWAKNLGGAPDSAISSSPHALRQAALLASAPQRVCDPATNHHSPPRQASAIPSPEDTRACQLQSSLHCCPHS